MEVLIQTVVFLIDMLFYLYRLMRVNQTKVLREANVIGPSVRLAINVIGYIASLDDERLFDAVGFLSGLNAKLGLAPSGHYHRKPHATCNTNITGQIEQQPVISLACVGGYITNDLPADQSFHIPRPLQPRWQPPTMCPTTDRQQSSQRQLPDILSRQFASELSPTYRQVYGLISHGEGR